MNMISELRQRVRQCGKAEITAAEYNQLQTEWITRSGIDASAQYDITREAFVANLEQQLAAALAAIKSKDAALQSAISAHGYGSGDLHDALAIQPDDSALKAWLGEPRSYLYKFNSEFGGGTFWSHRPTHNGNAALESIPLYSPKGMK